MYYSGRFQVKTEIIPMSISRLQRTLAMSQGLDSLTAFRVKLRLMNIVISLALPSDNF